MDTAEEPPDSVVELCALLVGPRSVPEAAALWCSVFGHGDVTADQESGHSDNVTRFLATFDGTGSERPTANCLKVALHIVTCATREQSSLQKDIKNLVSVLGVSNVDGAANVLLEICHHLELKDLFFIDTPAAIYECDDGRMIPHGDSFATVFARLLSQDFAIQVNEERVSAAAGVIRSKSLQLASRPCEESATEGAPGCVTSDPSAQTTKLPMSAEGASASTEEELALVQDVAAPGPTAPPIAPIAPGAPAEEASGRAGQNGGAPKDAAASAIAVLNPSEQTTTTTTPLAPETSGQNSPSSRQGRKRSSALIDPPRNPAETAALAVSDAEYNKYYDPPGERPKGFKTAMSTAHWAAHAHAQAGESSSTQPPAEGSKVTSPKAE